MVGSQFLDFASARSLALIAGVERKDVLLDRENKRAQATAQPLEGLTLAGYRELERRLERTVPGWTVELRPPLAALPEVTVGEDGLDAENATRLALIGWAAKRTGLRITLSGSDEALHELNAVLGEDARFIDTRSEGQGNAVSAAWSTTTAR